MHSNAGTLHRGYASRALFPVEKGLFSNDKKGTSLFIAKSWEARAPSAPPPLHASMEQRVRAAHKDGF